MLQRSLRALLVVSAAAVVTPSAAAAFAPPSSRGSEGLPAYDVRTDAGTGAPVTKAAVPSRAARAARSDLRRSLGRQAIAETDRRTGTVRLLARLDGTLTGPSSAAPRDTALAYVRGHLGALGLSSGDVSSLGAAGTTVSKTGLRVMRWTQSFRGIPAFDNSLRVALTKDGAVLAVLGAPAHGLAVAAVTPDLSSTDAVAAVLRNVGSSRPLSRVAGGPAGPERQTVFENGDRASLVLFVEGAATRLAWSTFVKVSSTATYHAVVDAATGRILYRADTVKFAAGDASIYLNHPGAAAGGTAIKENLATEGFITGTPPNLETGAYASAWSDVNDNDAVDSGESITPTSGDFSDPQTQHGTTTPACATLAPCSWTAGADFGAGTDWKANRRQNGVQAFWFASNFHNHLAGANIGFTGPANFEASDGDPVQVQNDDGADTSGFGGPDGNHVDNANMNTLPNPQPPIMQMYLFFYDAGLSNFHNINGGDDATIVYHEYTHGLSNRLVTEDGTPNTGGALNSPQAGAMGEAWSDWYAKDYLAAQDLQPDTNADGEVSMGEFTDAVADQIRTQPLDCPVGSTSPACPGTTGAGTGGYTYGDFGHIIGGPEVHADGEIWGETLWDIRTALGSATTEKLVTDGMRLSPPEPSMLDERNAILLADVADNSSANLTTLWDAFSTRGMGFFAGAVSGFDVSPVEDFSAPPAPGGPTGTVAGTVTDADSGLPIDGVKVGIGGFINSAPPGFAALSSLSGADGNYSIGPVPVGSYPKVAVLGSAGFDAFEFPATITSGATVTRDAALRRDWSSSSGGADVAATNADTYAPYGCGAHALIDQTQGAGWSADNPRFPTPDVNDPYVVVRLPQTIDVTKFLADPANTCGDDASAATKDYTIETSPNGSTWTTASTGAFAPADAGRLNEVTPAAGATGVRYVKLTLHSAQDETGPAGHDYVDFTELEVLGHSPNLLPAGTLAADTDAVQQGGSVRFTAAFTDPDSKITGYGWDFNGDGVSDQTTSAPAVDHVFSDAGTPTVTVLANDFRGGSGSASKAITVNAPPVVPPVVAPPAKPKPILALGKAGKGRISVKITCSSACTAKGSLKAVRSLRKKLRLRSATLGAGTKALGAAGTRTLTIKVSRKTLKAARRRKVKKLARLTLTVTVTDAGGQVAKLTRKVTIRL